MQFWQLLLNQLKILYGDLKFEFDRQNQIVRVKKQGEIKEYTYDEVVDLLEKMLND